MATVKSSGVSSPVSEDAGVGAKSGGVKGCRVEDVRRVSTSSVLNKGDASSKYEFQSGSRSSSRPCPTDERGEGRPEAEMEKFGGNNAESAGISSAFGNRDGQGDGSLPLISGSL